MKRIAMLVALVAGIAVARADDKAAQARAAADEAAKLYHQESYAAAAVKFRLAFELSNDPSYLFNIAQAYRLADDCVNAAEYYERFLAIAVDPPEKTRTWHEQSVECAKARKPPTQPTTTVTTTTETPPTTTAPVLVD